MYYQNGNYMQDLNYYNQTPNMGYNPYPYGGNYYSNQNRNMNGINSMPTERQNLNSMYPAVYRIISPVVSQVLSENQGNYLTEDSLNNMVDTVYHIVEGDINLGNESNGMNHSSSENTNNTNASNCERNSSTSRQNNTSTTTSRTTTQNQLLRDLIKIMILNEISQRQNNINSMMMQNNMTNMMPNNMQNTNITQQPMYL